MLDLPLQPVASRLYFMCVRQIAALQSIPIPI